jgi:hypothetical protein
LGTATIAGAATLSGLPLPARAKAPFAKDQAPYFYRFAHGKMQATVISDGILPLGEPSGTFLGSSKDEIGKMLTDNFLSPTNVVLEQNILVTANRWPRSRSDASSGNPAGEAAHRVRLRHRFQTIREHARAHPRHAGINRIPLIAYHFPWPGLGNVAKHRDGFRYFAAPLQMVLDAKG